MAENKKDGKERKTLSLGSKGTLSLGSKAPKAHASGSAGGVSVEVRRRRGADAQKDADAQKNLTSAELDSRVKALEKARQEGPARSTLVARQAPPKPDETPAQKPSAETLRQRELDELKRIEDAEKEATSKVNDAAHKEFMQSKARKEVVAREQPSQDQMAQPDPETAARVAKRPMRKAASPDTTPSKAPSPSRRTPSQRRHGRKLTVTQVLNQDYDRNRGPSLSAQRRAREKERMKMSGGIETQEKKSRDVTVPETITVQELANRMTERSGDVIKTLMKLGVMATINQSIDADTAELVIEEFGHKIKRVTEADVESSLIKFDDTEEDLSPRAPVVTVMGHVDHGKTSLLDALRETDVTAGEAGGITQHIGAYQVTLGGGDKITFLDTPGHAAFTEMRSRGANVTDIVVLVVAADDSVMPQTIEAINHAKAAEVPIIVAINKVDLPDANPTKIKQDLLQYEVISEEMGGDVMCIEISAKKRMNLDKLEEAILLQAEMLEVKSNKNAPASGTIVEAKQERGRGSVATVLIGRGTLKIGNIFVCGSEWGRVRAIINDQGKNLKDAGPSQPVEILGLNGTPSAGDDFAVVENEAKAREITEYRTRKKLEAKTAVQASSVEQMFAAARQEGEVEILPIVIKADVHGSVEAIMGSLQKMTEENTELDVRILHSGVGGITETDISLAAASGAMVIGFNVRANQQAKQMADNEDISIQYYSIIYNLIDDVKAMLGGMLSPERRETYMGRAEIRQVFNVSKVGKVAGCLVMDGVVQRGAGVRLLRDDVVIHEGTLKTLRRFKEEVKEVSSNTECGMAFESYDDVKEGDVIECFKVEEVARTID